MLTLAALRAHSTPAERALAGALADFGLSLIEHAGDMPIPGSYWGEPEAGIIGDTVHARGDTPIHSVLHEACHLICMGPQRRASVRRDAGGDDLEEAAVCYLQLLIAEQLPGVGWRRLAADMDSWGYSFRIGATADWFMRDADDAAAWLHERGLLPQLRASVTC